MKTWFTRWFTLFLLFFVITCPAYPDGGYVSERSDAVSADQRAILVRIGDEISITYSTGYTGNGEDFGWILPVPEVPDIENVFETGEEGEDFFWYLDEETILRQASSSSGGCFPEGTPIHTLSGLRPIETIEAGDEIWSYDWDQSGWVTSRVLLTKTHDYEGDMVTLEVGGENISVTGNHPFFVTAGDTPDSRTRPADLPPGESVLQGNGRWVEARQLRTGDRLMTRDREVVMVVRSTARRSRQTVYNLSLAGSANYAVHQRGFLVHNKGGSEEGGMDGGGVSVYGQVTLEHYEVSILGAGSGSVLMDWLRGNGYSVDSAARSILDDYIFQGWSFVAVRLVPEEALLRK